jgi:hypothetical protein
VLRVIACIDVRAEQIGAEQIGAEQSRAEQSRAELLCQVVKAVAPRAPGYRMEPCRRKANTHPTLHMSISGP